MTQRVVYLPIELKHRELPSRLFIASHLLAAGCTVVVGNHWSMTAPANLAALPEGVFLYKSANKVQGANMVNARGAGHVIAVNDEEVLSMIDDVGYLSGFSDYAALVCDLFLAQSGVQKEAIVRKFPGLAGKVRVTGNPRVALMAEENRHIFTAIDDRVAPLKPYILFNTNFSIINSLWNSGGSLNMGVHEDTGVFDGADREQRTKEFQETLAWEKGNHQAMLALLRWAVENLKGLRFVVRPHPGERAEYWEKMLADVSSAVVITQSDPHPWVLGSELVVHTCCTTGLEAALLGKPALNLLPTDRPLYKHIMNLVNPVVRSPEDAARAIVAFLADRTGPIAETSLAALETYLPGYRDGSAVRKMADALVELASSIPTQGPPLSWRGTFVDTVRTDVQRTKFTATEAEIKEGLASVSPAARARAKVTTLGDSLFTITPE